VLLAGSVTTSSENILKTFMYYWFFNPLNTELNPICHLLVLLGARHILHVSGLRVKFISVSFFFFFRWRYSTLWALACRTIPLHLFLSITNCLRLLTPNTWRSVSTFSLPSFPGSSFSSRLFQLLSEDLFGLPILLHSLQVTQLTYPLLLYPF